MPDLESPIGPRVVIDGRRYVFFGGNDYLGLAGHPALAESAAAAARLMGVNVAGSRRTTGTTPSHRALESELAAFLGREDACTFASGFLGGIVALPEMLEPGDLIAMDDALHPCLEQALPRSAADPILFAHHDPLSLRRIVERASGRIVVLVDGVDPYGSVAPLDRIGAELAAHDHLLIVDDAHGAGVLGRSGGGTADHFGIVDDNVVQVGTLSKAFGAFGGFVAATKDRIARIRSRSRAWGASTPLPPPLVAAARAAIALLDLEIEQRLTTLRRHVERLRNLPMFSHACENATCFPVFSPPDILGDRALQLQERLLSAGVYVPVLRYPAASDPLRVRFVVTAAHGDAEMDALERALRNLA